jgi:signal transduction histidine kinase
MIWRDIPIQRKLLVVIMLPCGVALLLAGLALTLTEAIGFRRDVQLNASVLATLIGNSGATALKLGDTYQEDAQRKLEELGLPAQLAAALYDANDTLYAEYPLHSDFPIHPERTAARFERGRLVLFQPIQSKGETVGTVCLLVDLGDLSDRLRLFAGIVLAVLCSSILVAFLLSSRLQRLISGPILALADTAAVVASGRDYSKRAMKISNDELGRLTDVFNHMLDQIEEQDKALRALNAVLEQRVLQRTEELSAANRELQSFSYSVSHDLRAPLRQMDGFSQALLEDYRDKLDAEGVENLEFIRRAAQKMAKLIDDLLRLSRIGQDQMRWEETDLSAMAVEITQELQLRDTGRKIEWTIESGVRVIGDRALLRIALENLLENAWKFTAPRETACIGFGTGTQGGGRLFTVRDNGVGFDMAYASKLFSAFQRLHTAKAFPGTGIGLAIVQRVITRHGGRVWAESIVDKGSTFHFTLNEKRGAHE